MSSPRALAFLFRESNRTLWAGVASGLLLALALAARGTGPLAFVALVPLLAALDSAPPPRSAMRAGFACGLVFFLLSCAWVPFAGTGRLGLVLVYLVFAPVLALPVAGFALAAAWLRRFGRPTLLVAAPALWVTTELARYSSELGSQFHLGYALADHPVLIQLAALGGVHLVSLWIVAVNATLVGVALAPRRVWPALLTLVVLPCAFGAAASRAAPQPTPERRVTVAGVQPEVRAHERYVPGHFDDHLRELLSLSERTLGDRPDLIIWPESAFERLSPAAGAPFLGAIAHHLGTPLLSGVWRLAQGEGVSLRNSSLLATPDGAVIVAADKVNPIWVFESAPQSLLGQRLADAGIWPGRFAAGDIPDVLLVPRTAAPIRLGVLVCVDTTYPELARDLRRRGAELLVTIANEADSGRLTSALQARIARLRAVESRVPLVRVANTGPSEWVDARGHVVASIEPGVSRVWTASLDLGEDATLYTRFGDAPTSAVAIATPAFLAALGVARQKRRALRGRGRTPLTLIQENGL
ncbi:MAG TPA: apolipoprotein N-acyltransferase [Myxococcota bacterium]|nr:apolipoprotein N-acyltransferase [Myxococcota bacterium]